MIFEKVIKDFMFQQSHVISNILNKLDEETFKKVILHQKYATSIVYIIAYYMLRLKYWPNVELKTRLFSLIEDKWADIFLNTWLTGFDLAPDVDFYFSQSFKMRLIGKNVSLKDDKSQKDDRFVITSKGSKIDLTHSDDGRRVTDAETIWKKGLISLESLRMLNRLSPHSMLAHIARILLEKKLLLTGYLNDLKRGGGIFLQRLAWLIRGVFY